MPLGGYGFRCLPPLASAANLGAAGTAALMLAVASRLKARRMALQCSTSSSGCWPELNGGPNQRACRQMTQVVQVEVARSCT